ncbi:hypothetical protein [Pontibacillus yanchengensis]|uniref:Uncharacterized protein n=1 Tax=Pontibacillus yanchengensis Y32 TaxID=1385514 RepID=A0A0A2T6P9_9BACI|nr:hypothetical protein [Pontibacillus yanchengensis]KGP71179.1 hypothetical protein N782_20950 [Pontibacillus yanchengensis Y32]
MKRELYIRFFVVGFFLILLSAPYIIVVSFDFFPNGYSYKSSEEKFYIQHLNSINHVEREISVKEASSNSQIVDKYEARSIISDIQTWYRKLAPSIGMLLGSIFLLFLPRTFIKESFRELKEELENDFPTYVKRVTELPREMKSDFPRLSNWLFDRDHPNIIGLVSLLISLFMILNSIIHYPVSEVSELDTLVRRLVRES